MADVHQWGRARGAVEGQGLGPVSTPYDTDRSLTHGIPRLPGKGCAVHRSLTHVPEIWCSKVGLSALESTVS